MSRILILGLAFLAPLSLGASSDPTPTPSEVGTLDRQLNAIQDQIVALEIEKALEGLNAILERADLTSGSRLKVLDLRAQAEVARDDLDAAEKDYRALLELQPGYAPDRGVTSKKAMERFLKLQAEMIGTVRVDVDPKDAAVSVDGRPAFLSPDGVVPVISGERLLHFERKGFDAQDVTVHAPAGQATTVQIRMVSNSRTLVARTDVGGVSVSQDGVEVGVTAFTNDLGADAHAPATLVLENVAIGEHEFRFAKSCFAVETLEDIVSVDLADRSPKLLRVIAMRPSRTRVTATGATYQGELDVDGERVATLPLTTFALCPGRRTLEVVASGRVVWSGELSVEETDLTMDLTPRPTAVLVGSAWPASWGAATASWSLTGRIDPPRAADLTTPEGWTAVPLPPGTDLAVAVIPHAGVAGDDRVVLYSPALQEVEDRALPPKESAPDWRIATIGASFVDAGPGIVVVGSTVPTGPAARAGLLPGDRLVAVGGRTLTGMPSLRDALTEVGPGSSVELDVAPPAGPQRKVSCATVGAPRSQWNSTAETSVVVRAAWATVGAASGGPDATIALANLASLLSRSGREGAALDAWRRVRAFGSGAFSPRAAYEIGKGLEAAGKRPEAIEAYNQAHAEGLEQGDLVLAAAAADRLEDLGIAPH